MNTKSNGKYRLERFGASFPAVISLMVCLFAGDLRSQSLSITPSSGPANCLVTATASGFSSVAPGEYGNTGFYVDTNEFLGACPPPVGVSSWANCTLMLRVPTTGSSHVFTARCGEQSASATFTVESPTVSVTPTWGLQNTEVTVNGYTFAAVGYAGVYVDGAYQTQKLTDESGDFTVSFTMPYLSYGPHIIEAICAQSATTSFYVTTNIGSVLQLTNSATVTHPGGQPMPLQPGMPVYLGDTISTGPGSKAFVTLVDDTQFTMSQNTQFNLNEYAYDPNNSANNSARYNFFGGAFSYISGLIGKNSNPDVNVNTSVGGIGVRGTQYIVRMDPCSSIEEIDLIEGELAITPKATPGVTNIVDAPVTIFLTTNSITTNSLTEDQYNAISNEVFAATGTVTYASWATSYFGCTNNNPAAAPDADPDGDGVNNWNEFLAGTNPTSRASAFRILSAVPSGNDMLISWTCGAGRTNILQSATVLNGAWSSIFTNVFPSGYGDGTTNYMDSGGLAGVPAKYYRVQLVQ